MGTAIFNKKPAKNPRPRSTRIVGGKRSGRISFPLEALMLNLYIIVHANSVDDNI